MATLGNIRWGAQYKVVDANNTTTTKTVNGLNLDDSNTPAAESVNAGIVNELIGDLSAFSNNTLQSVSLIETRQVNTSG